MSESTSNRASRQWFDYRTIWRWHFYAGVFTIPFVLILSVTGTIYLFKSQIETWEERSLSKTSGTNRGMGTRIPLVDQVHSAVAAVEGCTFDAFEVPAQGELGVSTANRVIVRKSKSTVRVFVDPSSGSVLGSIVDDERTANIAKHIHGELLLGKRGSYLVELAASWTLVMVLTGIVLWWPGNVNRLAGVVYPRLTRSGRVFWRDLHSVGGAWVSFLVMFLIITGLPWATFWGDYFKSVRKLTGTDIIKQDWESGHEQHGPQHAIKATRPKTGGSPQRRTAVDPNSYRLAELDRVAPVAMTLGLAPPALIRPPDDGSSIWSIESVTANRPLRKTVRVNGATGEIVSESGFGDRHWIDQAVGHGIALHEGQRFGVANQLLALVATGGLMLLSFSGIALWWRRRVAGTLGAPTPSKTLQPVSGRRRVLLLGILTFIAICLPLFGVSLVIVLIFERLVVPRFPAIRIWLGLNNRVRSASSIVELNR